MEKFDIGVVGGGTFGTTMAYLLSIGGHRINFWLRNKEQVDSIKKTRENIKYLAGYKLNKNIEPTDNLKLAVKDKPIIFVCIPSISFREVAQNIGEFTEGNQILVSCTKGIEAESFKLMSEILLEETCCLKVGVLSGPNLAKEIMDGTPTGTVIASNYFEVINMVQKTLSSEHMRVYSNNDIYGVELGGTLKNIYAVATGLISALKMGNNTTSLLMSRGLAEMSRFAVSMGADPMTFIGLAGVGDLIATCSSPLSRNYRVGFQLGNGKSLQEATDSLGEVAEGVQTINIVYQKIKEAGVGMPILESLYQILYEDKDIQIAIKELMLLEQTLDIEFTTKK